MIATAPAPSAPRSTSGASTPPSKTARCSRFQGRVAQVIGLSIEVEGLRLAVGDVCTILPEMAGRRTLHGSEEDAAPSAGPAASAPRSSGSARTA